MHNPKFSILRVPTLDCITILVTHPGSPKWLVNVVRDRTRSSELGATNGARDHGRNEGS